MSIIGYVACYVATIINLIVLLFCYYKFNGDKFVLKLKHVLSVILISVIVYLVNMYITTTVKFLLIYILLFFLFMFVSIDKQEPFKIASKTLIIYVLMIISDVFSSIILMQFDLSSFANHINIIKAFGTLLNSVSMLIIFCINPLINLLKKLLDLIFVNKNRVIQVFAILSFIIIAIIDSFHHERATISTFVFSVLLLLFLCLMISILFYQIFKRKTVEKEKQQLLVLMHEYESILNQTSENRHEILNDLLILKSIYNKKPKEYNKMLDSIIRQYDTKKFRKYTNLAKLPSGVKGIIYYKMAYINETDINFSTVVNGIDYKKFESMDNELYYKVCKILGILMDNAIEACGKSNNKKLIVSVYSEDELLCVEIDNDYIGNIEKDKINERGYSTKSKGRGHGLAILNRVVNESEVLSFKQFVTDDVFSSILKIKL